MEAWGKAHNAGDKILMAGDPFCKFIKDIGADVDKSERGLGIRSSRFTMLVENSIIKEIKEEKDYMLTHECPYFMNDQKTDCFSSNLFLDFSGFEGRGTHRDNIRFQYFIHAA